MKIEFRLNEIVLEGYVNVTTRDSRILSAPRGKFVERVDAGVFTKALRKNDDVKLTFNHLKLLGSTKTGEVKLWEDSIGLQAKATVTDPEIIDKAKRGELKGWSFAFSKEIDRWEDTGKGYQRRTLEDINLIEVSIVDRQPAYIGTSINMLPERLETAATKKWNAKTASKLSAEIAAAKATQLRVLEVEALRKAAGRTGKMKSYHDQKLEEIARLRTAGKK